MKTHIINGAIHRCFGSSIQIRPTAYVAPIAVDTCNHKQSHGISPWKSSCGEGCALT